MNRASLAVASVAFGLWSSGALAAAACEGPVKVGNTWNLVCTADGEGDAYYQCDYELSLTDAQGNSATVEAEGSVGQGQRGIIIWSAIQHEGSEITAARITNGSCSL